MNSAQKFYETDKCKLNAADLYGEWLRQADRTYSILLSKKLSVQDYMKTYGNSSHYRVMMNEWENLIDQFVQNRHTVDKKMQECISTGDKMTIIKLIESLDDYLSKTDEKDFLSNNPQLETPSLLKFEEICSTGFQIIEENEDDPQIIWDEVTAEIQDRILKGLRSKDPTTYENAKRCQQLFEQIVSIYDPKIQSIASRGDSHLIDIVTQGIEEFERNNFLGDTLPNTVNGMKIMYSNPELEEQNNINLKFDNNRMPNVQNKNFSMNFPNAQNDRPSERERTNENLENENSSWNRIVPGKFSPNGSTNVFDTEKWKVFDTKVQSESDNQNIEKNQFNETPQYTNQVITSFPVRVENTFVYDQFPKSTVQNYKCMNDCYSQYLSWPNCDTSNVEVPIQTNYQPMKLPIRKVIPSTCEPTPTSYNTPTNNNTVNCPTSETNKVLPSNYSKAFEQCQQQYQYNGMNVHHYYPNPAEHIGNYQNSISYNWPTYYQQNQENIQNNNYAQNVGYCSFAYNNYPNNIPQLYQPYFNIPVPQNHVSIESISKTDYPKNKFDDNVYDDGKDDMVNEPLEQRSMPSVPAPIKYIKSKKAINVKDAQRQALRKTQKNSQKFCENQVRADDANRGHALDLKNSSQIRCGPRISVTSKPSAPKPLAGCDVKSTLSKNKRASNKSHRNVMVIARDLDGKEHRVAIPSNKAGVTVLEIEAGKSGIKARQIEPTKSVLEKFNSAKSSSGKQPKASSGYIVNETDEETVQRDIVYYYDSTFASTKEAQIQTNQPIDESNQTIKISVRSKGKSHNKDCTKGNGDRQEKHKKTEEEKANESKILNHSQNQTDNVFMQENSYFIFAKELTKLEDEIENWKKTANGRAAAQEKLWDIWKRALTLKRNENMGFLEKARKENIERRDEASYSWLQICIRKNFAFIHLANKCSQLIREELHSGTIEQIAKCCLRSINRIFGKTNITSEENDTDQLIQHFSSNEKIVEKQLTDEIKNKLYKDWIELVNELHKRNLALINKAEVEYQRTKDEIARQWLIYFQEKNNNFEIIKAKACKRIENGLNNINANLLKEDIIKIREEIIFPSNICTDEDEMNFEKDIKLYLSPNALCEKEMHLIETRRKCKKQWFNTVKKIEAINAEYVAKTREEYSRNTNAISKRIYDEALKRNKNFEWAVQKYESVLESLLNNTDTKSMESQFRRVIRAVEDRENVCSNDLYKNYEKDQSNSSSPHSVESEISRQFGEMLDNAELTARGVEQAAEISKVMYLDELYKSIELSAKHAAEANILRGGIVDNKPGSFIPSAIPTTRLNEQKARDIQDCIKTHKYSNLDMYPQKIPKVCEESIDEKAMWRKFLQFIPNENLATEMFPEYFGCTDNDEDILAGIESENGIGMPYEMCMAYGQSQDLVQLRGSALPDWFPDHQTMDALDHWINLRN